MRALILLASLAAISPVASAQSQDSRPALGYVSARDEGSFRSHLEGRSERQECLIRKSNGRRECHTRAEWRRIAARIEHGDR